MKPHRDITKAGWAVLRRFNQAKARGALIDVTMRDGTPAKAMTLATGDGASKAACQKLQRQGYGLLVWNSLHGERFFMLSNTGSEAARCGLDAL